MSDQMPGAEEQIPSVEEIFQSLEGHPLEEQIPAFAAILQAMLGGMSEMEDRVNDYCKRLDEIDQQFHEEVYNPLKDGYKAKIRGMGMESLGQKYGAMFDPISEDLKNGFGIEDWKEKLYDMLEKMKEAGTYNEAEEPTYMADQHKEAMRRITALRGASAAPEASSVEVAIEGKPSEVEKEKEPEKPAPKSLREKKMNMRSNY